jgi:hypothetical protein
MLSTIPLNLQRFLFASPDYVQAFKIADRFEIESLKLHLIPIISKKLSNLFPSLIDISKVSLLALFETYLNEQEVLSYKKSQLLPKIQTIIRIGGREVENLGKECLNILETRHVIPKK